MMIKALIKKELSLTAHPMTYAMTFFGCMLLIPNYPYYVAFFYTMLGIFFGFMNGRENRDTLFTSILPVSKSEVVFAKVIFVYSVEIISILFSIPFAFLTNKINPNGGNAVGIEANVAFYGLVFIMFAIFNFIFIIRFYKTAYNVGSSFLVANIFVWLYIILAEVSVHIPKASKYLDTADFNSQIAQIPVLACGVLIFIVSFFIIKRRASSNFEKVDI